MYRYGIEGHRSVVQTMRDRAGIAHQARTARAQLGNTGGEHFEIDLSIQTPNPFQIREVKSNEFEKIGGASYPITLRIGQHLRYPLQELPSNETKLSLILGVNEQTGLPAILDNEGIELLPLREEFEDGSVGGTIEVKMGKKEAVFQIALFAGIGFGQEPMFEVSEMRPRSSTT